MDRDVIRGLAGEIAELAALDVQKENARLYRALNALKPIRPVVLMDELPWNQLEAGGELTLLCKDGFLRSVERDMRRVLYKWKHCRCDMIIEPFWRLSRVMEIPQYFGMKILEETIASDGGNNIISHHYDNQLPDMESITKLQEPSIRVDDAETARREALLNDIFGDLLPVRLTGVQYAGFFHPWDDLSRLCGVESILYNLYDEPDLMHALMRRYTDLSLKLLKMEEDMGLIDGGGPVLHCTAGLNDDLPAAEGTLTRKNIWGRGAAQIFCTVSPAMHEEFDIEYQKEFFAGFPQVYYGCCEPLHNKIDIVEKIPNVRKISITPWADVRTAAENMGKRFVMARKPNPACVAVPLLDEESARRDILETLDVCRANGTPCEFTLKDISSVHYNPANLEAWARVAMETVLNY